MNLNKLLNYLNPFDTLYCSYKWYRILKGRNLLTRFAITIDRKFKVVDRNDLKVVHSFYLPHFSSLLLSTAYFSCILYIKIG